MKRLLIVGMLLLAALHTNAQQALIADQNPNYQKSLDKYKDSPYLALQGTTKQQTYKAIDPMEEKRVLKALKREHRANRPLWRHQRALKRIENTRYFSNNFPSFRYNPYRPYHWHNQYNRRYGDRWLNPGTTFGLGLFGCSVFQ